MKTLALIWLAVIISAVGTVGFVNAEINKNVAETKSTQLQETAPASELQPANGLTINTYNPQQTLNGKYLQGSEAITNLRISQ